MLSTSRIFVFVLSCATVTQAGPVVSTTANAIKTHDINNLTNADILAFAPDLVNFQEDLDNLSDIDMAELRGMSLNSNLVFPHVEMSEWQGQQAEKRDISAMGNGTSLVIDWMKDKVQNKKACPKQFDSCGPVCLPRYHKACHCCAPEKPTMRRPFGCLKMKCCPCMDKQTLDFLKNTGRAQKCYQNKKNTPLECSHS